MEKQIYDIVFDKTNEMQTKMNEPFCLMKAEIDLKNRDFVIWKRNYRYQNTHAHDYYQLWYILKGSCKHKIDNRKFPLGSGDIIFIPPFSYHSMSDGSDDLIVIGVDFTEKFFSATESDKTLMLHCVTPICVRQSKEQSVFFADNKIENMLIEMLGEFELRSPFYDTIIKSDLSKLLVLLGRKNSNAATGNSKHERAVNEIQKYIHSKFNEKIAIEDLCKEVNMSETLLTTCFKNTTGKTIIEYINCLRIDKAKQLLAETDMRITDISYELGFNDGAYFNRVFKKTVGTSPNEYRKQKQKPQ